MIKRAKWHARVKSRRAKWIKMPLDKLINDLHCPMCKGKGSVWRDPIGRYSEVPYKCTICLGRGIPPIPMSEL